MDAQRSLLYAIAQGIIPADGNPVLASKWLHKVERPTKQTEYSLDQVLQMLKVLEASDIRAAAALALAYFAALRPAEIRGLMWDDYEGDELNIRRSVWRNRVGDTKPEDSAACVPVIEPLQGLLERLRAYYGGPTSGYILQNSSNKSLSLDSINIRNITPTLRAAGITYWRGFYPGRRGISSLVTNTSKNALNSTGLLRHTTPVTALRHYTRSSKSAISAAMNVIEEQALQLTETKYTVQ